MRWRRRGSNGEKKRDMFEWANWPLEFTLSADPSFQHDFPNMRPHLCVGEVSAATKQYNCIAWAALDDSSRWEPDPFFQYYWPDGVAREYTRAAYIEAYRTVGFEVCVDGTPEPGMDKIVLYTSMGEPRHAARRLPDGNWTSKLGDFEDIQHTTLDCLSGPLYGMPTTYMKRPSA